MRRVIFTKGLPASGKSTWARRWVDERPGRVRINRDDLRDMMSVEFRQDKEAIVLAASLNILRNALTLNLDVVLDNTNLNRQTVQHYLNVCDEFSAAVEWRVFDTDVDTCVERDKKRPRPVGEDVIRNMWRKYRGQFEEVL